MAKKVKKTKDQVTTDRSLITNLLFDGKTTDQIWSEYNKQHPDNKIAKTSVNRVVSDIKREVTKQATGFPDDRTALKKTSRSTVDAIRYANISAQEDIGEMDRVVDKCWEDYNTMDEILVVLKDLAENDPRMPFIISDFARLQSEKTKLLHEITVAKKTKAGIINKYSQILVMPKLVRLMERFATVLPQTYRDLFLKWMDEALDLKIPVSEWAQKEGMTLEESNQKLLDIEEEE